MSTMTASLAPIPDGCRMELSHGEAIEQIGKPTFYSVCGGRACAPRMPGTNGPFRIELHCGNGYRVYIYLHGSDTYIVQRIYRRGSREWVKGEARDVYAEQLSETVYRAGMFRDEWVGGQA